MIPSDQNASYQLPAFELITEVAPGEGCFGHIPSFPGLGFRADDTLELKRIAPDQIVRYIEWLIEENLTDINPAIAALTQWVHMGMKEAIRVVETERQEGSPPWISGNPAVLFDHDLHPLDDPAVTAHLRFTRQVLGRIGNTSATLIQTQQERKLNHEHRTIEDMLTHIGNCVWWYCSRINDGLPEPDERAEEQPLRRIVRLFDLATVYLVSVPLSERTIVHIPTRFLTNDPKERWTHTKVCRRQAEHAWEHLSELKQMARLERE